MANYRKETAQGIDFWRVDSDVNGNPRYVFHFLELARDYESALKQAHKIGGSKYRAKWFGGGIVIQSYNLTDTADSILAHRLSY